MEKDASGMKHKKGSKSLNKISPSVDMELKSNKSIDSTKVHVDTSNSDLLLSKNSSAVNTPKSSSLKGKKNKTFSLNGSFPNEQNLDREVTSTPYSEKKSKLNMKSIMKNSSLVDELETSEFEANSSRRKKRNKSVSFMIEDETASKKIKSEVSSSDASISSPKRNKYNKNLTPMKKKTKTAKQTNLETEKENIYDNKNPTDSLVRKKKNKVKGGMLSMQTDSDSFVMSEDGNNNVDKSDSKKKRTKKNRKETTVCDKPDATDSSGIDNNEEATNKKSMKKKQKLKTNLTETQDTDVEPQTKTRKKNSKPDVIAEDLQNLNIGDNPHTLMNLLDDLSVTDKNKKKNSKKQNGQKKGKNFKSCSSTETLDSEQVVEEKEKVKWNKRKWNKDRKPAAEAELYNSVILENLPLKIMLNYKKILTDHFGTFGIVKKIGIAEVYPTEEPKPVFTTTIHFCSEDAAKRVLEEGTISLEGSRVRVKRPLPATETTLVVRSYAELSEQAISSAFANVGRIRNIRQLIKGKKSMSTAFVEFDGPKTLERAIESAKDLIIGGKKTYVSKFEVRSSAKKTKKGDAAKVNNSQKPEETSDSDE